jgi:hypothetical protein
MFEVKVTLNNGHQEAYILRCAMEYVVDTLQDDYDIKLDDICEIRILRISSVADIRQGKVR